MLTGLTTSEINERAVYHAISARPYKRMVEKLVDQLRSARERTIERLATQAWRRWRSRAAACSSAPDGQRAPTAS